MSPSRLIRLLASAGAYMTGLATIALWWWGRPNRAAFAASVACGALALLTGPRSGPGPGSDRG